LLAVSPDGRRGFVSHNGLAGRRITALDLTQWKAGRRLVTGDDPSGIAFDRTGRLVLVANAGAGTVSVLNARTGKRRRLRVGGTPRAVAVTGGRGIVADAETGRLSAIRMKKGARA
jgi:DNA-binding beta-propeller fold protein YncE